MAVWWWGGGERRRGEGLGLSPALRHEAGEEEGGGRGGGEGGGKEGGRGGDAGLDDWPLNDLPALSRPTCCRSRAPEFGGCQIAARDCRADQSNVS